MFSSSGGARLVASAVARRRRPSPPPPPSLVASAPRRRALPRDQELPHLLAPSPLSPPTGSLIPPPPELRTPPHLSISAACADYDEFYQLPKPPVLVGVDEPPPSWSPVSSPDYADMYPKAAPSYPKGSPKFNLTNINSVGKKFKKKPSPKMKKASPKGSKPRASWNSALEKSLVDILHEHNTSYYRSQNGWSKETWNTMVKAFLTKHPYVQVTKSQIQDKEKDLKRDYRMLKDARNQSGAGWNETEYMLEAEQHLWDNLETSFGQRIKRFKTKAFPLFDSLAQLYEGSIATGAFNYTSNSTSAPTPSDVTEIESDGEEDMERAQGSTAREDIDDDLQMLDEGSTAAVRPPVEHGQVKAKKAAVVSRKKPKTSSGAGIVQVMERLVNIKEKEAEKESAQEFTISRCMDTLKKVDGFTADDKIPALEVFKNAQNREIFVNLVDDNDGTAIKWIRIQIGKLP